MSFSLTKPPDPVPDFGEYRGVDVRDWPLYYLHRMNSLAKDGRIMDKRLANHIMDVHKEVKEREER